MSGSGPGPPKEKCIQVKDHSRVLCQHLQQLRTQTSLVDLDIVCENHHINVHRVVMAACSRFFEEQLCKPNVRAPVSIRLEDFRLGLRQEAVSYIIEFMYRGEINIPVEKLTEVYAAAHTLGVIGLEHLPVLAETQRPTLINKEPLQIADDSETRRDINNIYNSINNSIAVPSSAATPTSMGKFSMDMNNINPFLNNAIQNDDISLLQTANEDNRNDRIYHDIIPISFADHSVISGGDSSTVGHSLYPGACSDVSNGLGELYCIIPEMQTYDKFAKESLNSLPPTNLQHQSLVTHDVAISRGHQRNLAALFEAASSEPMIANSVPELTHCSDPAPERPASPVATTTRHDR